MGCGHGIMSMAMARVVGKTGKVFSVDLQPDMIAYTKDRAAREGHADVVVPIQSTPEDIHVPASSVHFALLNWMFHEVPHAGIAWYTWCS